MFYKLFIIITCLFCFFYSIGIAANGIRGDTIHRIFHIPAENAPVIYYESLTPEKKAQLRNVLQRMRILIVDEISMVRSFLFVVYCFLLSVFN